MSRIAKAPISIPSGVSVDIGANSVEVKGSKGNMSVALHQSVTVSKEDGVIKVAPVSETKSNWAMAGTFRALINNMVIGTTTGFSKKLTLVGVGYRAAAKGKTLDLALGFSHPIHFSVPEGITIETPTQTEIIISGSDKQAVGQVAANIRAFRPPEPYKGKGVRYADEHVVRKQAKKK